MKLSKEKLQELGSWLTIEIMDGFASRAVIEDRWREMLRMYDALPEKKIRNFPIKNAPNIEVPLGAIASDAIYAQMLDLIFQTSPTLTIRPVGGRDVEDAKALQRWINWSVENQYKIREPVEHALLDDVQLGTAALYAPYVHEIVKHKEKKITYAGPRLMAIPIEDFLVPGGAFPDMQTAPWVAVRFYLYEQELETKAEHLGWNIKRAMRAGNVGFVRWTRERLGGTARSGKRISYLYEIMEIYCHYDIDDDGLEEDLYVVWDKTSRAVLYCDWNPYSYRPFAIMRYQPRAHLFYGMGCQEMLRYLERETSELHNQRNLNQILANTRLWKAKTGSVPEDFEVWPNRVVELDNPDDLKPEQMGDIYPSSDRAEEINLRYAEQRVGMNAMMQPEPGAMNSSRMPGITAMTFQQQANKRFSAVFDSARLCVAEAVRQCLYREQERLQRGDMHLRDEMVRVLGVEDGTRVAKILSDENFNEAYHIETTASSSSINREADRQSALMLANLMMTYYEKAIGLAQLMTTPGMPPPVQKIGLQAFQKASELMDRTLRTFDQVRDPQTFLLEVDDVESAMGQQLAQLDPRVLQTLLAGVTPAASFPNPGGVGTRGLLPPP